MCAIIMVIPFPLSILFFLVGTILTFNISYWLFSTVPLSVVGWWQLWSLARSPILLPFERDSHDLCSSLLHKPKPGNQRQDNRTTSYSNWITFFLLYSKVTDIVTHIHDTDFLELPIQRHLWKLIRNLLNLDTLQSWRSWVNSWWPSTI